MLWHLGDRAQYRGRHGADTPPHPDTRRAKGTKGTKGKTRCTYPWPEPFYQVRVAPTPLSPMKVTLVLTVLNEGESISALLDSVCAQTCLPDEIVVCDGGSRDDTVGILRRETRLPIRVIEAPGANISRGRNLAIAAASHDVIACTDAGVRLDACWLEKLVEGLVGHDQDRAMPAGAVAGFFMPDPRSTFEVAMSATVLPLLEEIKPAAFLPSSRSVAFTKAAWQAVGRYPEWLDYCEDLIFDLKLRQHVGAFTFAPDAIAYFRPRGTLGAFFKQYYRYARGDGKASLFLKRHLIRYATYWLALPLLIAGVILLSPVLKVACGLALVGGAAAYVRQPYRRLKRLAQTLAPKERRNAAFLVPVIRVTGDIAKMLGYPAGVWWRWKNKAWRS